MSGIAVAPQPSRRTSAALVGVSRWAVHVPATPELPAFSLGAEPDEIVSAGRAQELLGRKGLLSKEPATRLALCAVHRALGRAPALRPDGPPDPRTAVIACSDLGNAATVVEVARTAREQGVRAVSPMDIPNASSNVIASSVSIWFRFGGPSLMICSGATSGLDAIRLARLLLAADRADRVVVVGSEPDDAVVRALSAEMSRPPRAGAAAIILERVPDAVATAPRIGPVRISGPGDPPRSGVHGLSVCPTAAASIAEAAIDIEAVAGGLGGAIGVVQAAAAADLASRGEGRAKTVAVVSGTRSGGWRDAVVSASAPTGAQP